MGDYKPWVAQLSNGELLIIAFAPSPGHSGGSVPPNPKGTTEEHAVLWRSSDGGLSWGPRTFRNDLNGREWSLNVLADGTILAPNALLSADRNFNGTYAWLHRSTVSPPPRISRHE